MMIELNKSDLKAIKMSLKLVLDDLEEEYVDTLRKKWIETYRIGF